MFSTPLWLLTGAAMIIATIWFGYTFTPNEVVWRYIASDPFTQLVHGPGEYLYGSPIGPLVAHALGVGVDPYAFRAVQTLVLIASIVGTAYLVRTWAGDVAGRLFVVAWFCSPLANVHVTWIGQPDPITMAAATFVTVGPTWACIAGGMLLGFNHFEQGVFIVAAALILRQFVRRDGFRFGLCAGAGLAAGRALLAVYHNASNITVTTGRIDYFADLGFGDYFRAWGPNLPALIFSVHGVLWVAVVAMLRNIQPRPRNAVIVVQVGLLAPVLLTLDVTRVYALITWPIVMVCVMWAASQPETQIRRWAVLLAGTSLVVPRVIVAGGVVVSSWGRLL